MVVVTPLPQFPPTPPLPPPVPPLPTRTQNLNLPASALRVIKRTFQIERRKQATLCEELAALKKQLSDKEEEHKKELHMCRMVKKMDDQRISLLEDFTGSLQKKLQAQEAT